MISEKEELYMYRSGCGCNRCSENRGASCGCERHENRCGCNNWSNDWGNNEEFERMERLNREILRRRHLENRCARNFNQCIRSGSCGGSCGGNCGCGGRLYENEECA